ncbi:RNA polymerase-associated protein LEO1-like [Drosophila navojoa]|uniref:RNA polymerase-associated protein LEO1-like n=1 Tax=Drosophila navojoa TaxID=7232 RepID=UPI0008477982|nr:RNA polymerase-associated protein LEO1-like [Drosophila navojoa]
MNDGEELIEESTSELSENNDSSEEAMENQDSDYGEEEATESNGDANEEEQTQSINYQTALLSEIENSSEGAMQNQSSDDSEEEEISEESTDHENEEPPRENANSSEGDMENQSSEYDEEEATDIIEELAGGDEDENEEERTQSMNCQTALLTEIEDSSEGAMESQGLVDIEEVVGEAKEKIRYSTGDASEENPTQSMNREPAALNENENLPEGDMENQSSKDDKETTEIIGVSNDIANEEEPVQIKDSEAASQSENEDSSERDMDYECSDDCEEVKEATKISLESNGDANEDSEVESTDEVQDSDEE